MLNSKRHQVDVRQLTSTETYGLASCIFTRKPRAKSCWLFKSGVSYRRDTNAGEHQPKDYTKLINDDHPRSVYAYFLNMIINTPNVVIEESSAREVAIEVKDNPRKRFSIPTDFNKKYSDMELDVSGFESKGHGNLQSVTAFSSLAMSDDDRSMLDMVMKTEDPSFLTSDPNDPDHLNDEQIKQLVESKMRKLEKFNTKLERKEELALIMRYGIDSQTLDVLKRFQLRIRAWVMKRKFFKAVRMNEYIEHKKNYISLKKCVEKFDQQHKGDNFARYNKTSVNVFGDK